MAQPKQPAVIVFQNDDVSFQAWRTDHPQGFVVNVSNQSFALHRAHCSFFDEHPPKGNPYTGNVEYKVCSDLGTPAASILALWQWGRSHGKPDFHFTRRKPGKEHLPCFFCMRGWDVVQGQVVQQEQ